MDQVIMAFLIKQDPLLCHLITSPEFYQLAEIKVLNTPLKNAVAGDEYCIARNLRHQNRMTLHS